MTAKAAEDLLLLWTKENDNIVQKEVSSLPGQAPSKKVNKGLKMAKKLTELDLKLPAIQKFEQKKVPTIKQLSDLDNNEVKNSETVDSKPKRKYVLKNSVDNNAKKKDCIGKQSIQKQSVGK